MDKTTERASIALPPDDSPYARFVANEHGGFVPGVPARDLTRAEWLNLDKETRATCRATGLYTLTKEHADG